MTIFSPKSSPQSHPKNPSYIFRSFDRSCFTRSMVIESFCMISPRYPSLTIWNSDLWNASISSLGIPLRLILLESIWNISPAKSVKSLLGVPHARRIRSCHIFSSAMNSERLFSLEDTIFADMSLPATFGIPIFAASIRIVPRPQNGS